MRSGTVLILRALVSAFARRVGLAPVDLRLGEPRPWTLKCCTCAWEPALAAATAQRSPGERRPRRLLLALPVPSPLLDTDAVGSWPCGAR